MTLDNATQSPDSSGDIMQVCIKQRLILYKVLNGLFHSRCPDFHANEKIIILKQALSEQHVNEDKTKSETRHDRSNPVT